MNFQTQSILLLDDDAGQLELMRGVLQSHHITNKIIQLKTGSEVVAYLEGSGKFADRIEHPIPCFLLLDLVMDGAFDCLAWIRQHQEFRRLPVVVLTHSTEPEHIQRVYALGVNSYLVKPFDSGQIRELVKAINAYWVILVQKPTFA